MVFFAAGAAGLAAALLGSAAGVAAVCEAALIWGAGVEVRTDAAGVAVLADVPVVAVVGVEEPIAGAVFAGVAAPAGEATALEVAALLAPGGQGGRLLAV